MSSTKMGSKKKPVVIKTKKVVVGKPGKSVKSGAKGGSHQHKGQDHDYKPKVKVSTTPMAINNVATNPTFFRQIGRVKNPDSDELGMAFEVCQPLTTIITNGTDSTLFTNNSLATAGPGLINLTPDTLNGPIAAESNYWQKYRWRKLRIRYLTDTPTTVGNGFALCITDFLQAPPGSLATVMEVVPSVKTAFRENCMLEIRCPENGETFYNLLDASSNATYRQSVQYQLWGFPTANAITALTYGNLYIEGVLDFFGNTATQGITLTRLNYQEKILAESVVLNYRRRRDLRKGKKPLTTKAIADVVKEFDDEDDDSMNPIHFQYALLHNRNKFGDLSDEMYNSIQEGKLDFDKLISGLESKEIKKRVTTGDAWSYPNPTFITNDIFNSGSDSIRTTVVGPSNLTGSAVTVHNDGSFAPIFASSMRVIRSAPPLVRYKGKVVFNQLPDSVQSDIISTFRIPNRRNTIINIDFDKGTYLACDSTGDSDDGFDVSKIDQYKLIYPVSSSSSDSESDAI